MNPCPDLTRHSSVRGHWILSIPAFFILFGLVSGCHNNKSVKSPTQPTEAEAIFERRLKPIFASEQPSSCLECHLAGVDLKKYILPSHRETFVALRDRGLVDLENPRASRILAFINMEKPNGGQRLIPEGVRRAEYDAFSSWIEASARDPELKHARSSRAPQPVGPTRPDAVIRYGRRDRVLAAFEQSIWAQRRRCDMCHAAGGEQNARLVEENGKRVTWIKEDAGATFDAIVKAGLVDVLAPEKSELLTKPTLQEDHGGGQKMEVGDLSYKTFRGFIEDYARIVNDQYDSSLALPVPSRLEPVVSDFWVKLVNTPAAWSDRLLEIRLFARDPATGQYGKQAFAVADRSVSGEGRLWQQSLILLSPPVGAAQLPAGPYLARIFVDKTGKLENNWQLQLDDSDVVGQTELQTPMQSGYGKMTVIEARRFEVTGERWSR